MFCGCEGSGTQSIRAFALQCILILRGRVKLGFPFLLFCDSHNFILVVKIQIDLPSCGRMGSILWALWVPKSGTGATAWLREWMYLGRQTGVNEVVRKAEQIPSQFLQSYITPNGSRSSPLHHSPVSEISRLLLASGESICQTHKSPSNTAAL